MKITRLVIMSLVIGLLLSACAAGELIPAPTMTQGPVPGSTPTPVVNGVPKTNPESKVSNTPDTSQATNYPVAVQQAEKSLSVDLNIDISQVKVIRFEDVQWPDGCLGIERPGVMCTMAIVPGYRVILEANGKQYEYRTNDNGSTAVLYTGDKLSGSLPIGGSQGSTSGAALVWHIEGGLAGLCQDLTINLAGNVTASTCAGGQSRILKQTQLTDAEMTQLNQWLRQYQSFQLDISDPAVADRMSTHLSLSGVGSVEASAADQQAVLAFAKNIFNRIAA